MICRPFNKLLSLHSLLLIMMASFCSPAIAQDVAGLFGTWEFSGTLVEPSANCGVSTSKGQLRVFQRASNSQAILYQGVVTSVLHRELCPDEPEETIQVLLVVDGSKVSVTYENPDWYPDILELDGTVMEGTDAIGTNTRWVRTAGPSDSARIEGVRASIAQREYDAGSKVVRNALISNGHSEAQAEELLWDYFDGMADCQIDPLVEVANENSLSIYEIINIIDTDISGGMTNSEMYYEFDQRSYDKRSVLCVETLTRELGINELIHMKKPSIVKETESRTVAEPE